MEGIIIYNDNMRTDIFGQIILTESDLCDLYLKDPSRILVKVLSEDCIKFSDTIDILNKPNILQYVEPQLSIDEFDASNQNNWNMPESYRHLDIAKWILEQCRDDAELQRAGQELLLFQERGMFDLLRYMKYLVDTMRTNNIVWGVGRGSSTASFVLYIIGIHKINSLYYDLPIEEFLK